VMTDLLVGATAGLSSSVFHPCAAGQASSGTQTIIPLCHMPTKRIELLRTDIDAKRDFLANQPVEPDGTPHEQTQSNPHC
jgi:hypothetical protein